MVKRNLKTPITIVCRKCGATEHWGVMRIDNPTLCAECTAKLYYTFQHHFELIRLGIRRSV